MSVLSYSKLARETAYLLDVDADTEHEIVFPEVASGSQLRCQVFLPGSAADYLYVEQAAADAAEDTLVLPAGPADAEGFTEAPSHVVPGGLGAWILDTTNNGKLLLRCSVAVTKISVVFLAYA